MLESRKIFSWSRI